MSDRDNLERLLTARHPCISIVSNEEAYVLDVLYRLAIDQGREVREWSASRGLTLGPLTHGERVADTENPAAAMFYHLKHDASCFLVLLDLAPHLGDAKVVRMLRDAVERARQIRGHVILIDHEEPPAKIVEPIATRFEVSLPDESELAELVRDTIQREHRQERVNAKVSREGLATIVRTLRGLSRRQAEQIIVDTVAEDRRLDERDISRILARKRQIIHRDGLLQYVESPADLSEIAGFHRFKQWLEMRRETLSAKAIKFGLRPPRGVLMLGVPGAGKSLCARAVATAWHRPLLRLDPGVLYDRYIGESERRLREALQQAEAMSPIVLWVDEIEKGFASAAAHNVDGGLSQRMFGSLLTWMQDHHAPVFMFATANNIEALPPELLRKGRFDEIFFVDMPTPEIRKRVFEVHLAKRGRDASKFDLATLVAASDGFTGAEIEQAIISALHEAFATGTDVNTELIAGALEHSPPLSVTMGEEIAQLRSWAAERCVPVD